MDFLRTNILPRHTMASEIIELDLGVNPLSHLIITIAGYNVSDEATLAEIAAFLNSVKITNNGITEFKLESEQIMAVNNYLFGAPCMLHNNVATDNAQRVFGVIIPMGRKLYNPAECFPATIRGEFQLAVDTTIPATSFDNGIISIDSIELPGATPSQHLRCKSLAVSAPGSTGEKKVGLNTGNRYAAIIIGHTTYTLTSSHTFGVQGLSILKNNVEHTIASMDILANITEKMLYTNTLPRDIAAFGQALPDKFTVVDFNPNRDDETFLETEGLSSLDLNINYGVSEAISLTKLEIVKH